MIRRTDGPTTARARRDVTADTRPGSPASSPSPARFVAVVFALSLPFWLIGTATGARLSADLPVSALMIVCPATAAAILVHRDEGRAGVGRLLRRSFDHERIRDKRWYLPILLLGPGIYAVTYALLRATGTPVPDLRLSAVAAAVTFLAFFAGALGEELGWSGYAVDPLQERWNALTAGLALGAVWAAWHLVPLVQAGRSFGWIAWWALGTVGFRVLLTWIYDNTAKSVLAVALTHALANLAWIGPFLDFGDDGYPYAGERLSALLIVGAATAVTLVWGQRTLTR